MLEENKPSLRLADRKNETSNPGLKFSSTSKKSSFGVSKAKTGMDTLLKIPSETEFKNCFGDGCLAIKPRDESPDEVEEIVFEVTKGDESPEKSPKMDNRPRKNVAFALFNDQTSQENNTKRKTNKTTTNEDDQYYINNLKLLEPGLRKPERSYQFKKKIPNARKRDQTDKNRQIKYTPATRRSSELKRNKTQDENPFEIENKLGRKDKISEESKIRMVQPKKRKPSEIPLRKNRTDASRKPKAVSTLLQKPLKEVESSSSFDFYANKKPFSPIDEISLCSELQITINAISSSEKLSRSNSPIDSERPATRENIFNIKLERCIKNLNIPVVSGTPSMELLEEKSTSGKKQKFLDLEKVKTSSFTVLESSPAALDRLESLHKQNVQSKNKVSSGVLKKPKPMTPKQFFNSIKRRSSRKSLPCRLSNAKNKSTLKVKIKKDVQEDTSLREEKTNSTDEVLEDKKLNNTTPDSLEGGFNEDLNSEPKDSIEGEDKKEGDDVLRPKTAKPDDNSALKMQNSRQKDESKIPTPQKHVTISLPQTPQNNENSVKLTSFSNIAANKKKYASLKRKTAPSSPSSVTERNQLISRNQTAERKEDKDNTKNPAVKEASKSSREVKKRKKASEAKISFGKAEQEQKSTGEKDKNPSLVVRGTALNFKKNEASKTQENSKGKVKMQLKIDLSIQDASEENCKITQSCDWLFKNDTEEPKEKLPKEGKIESSFNLSPGSLSVEWAQETENTETDLNLPENPNNFSFLKEKLLNNMSSLKTKKMRKKMRSDAGDRPLASFRPFFDSDLPIQNKVKIGNKPRNSLTRPNNMDEQREIFEEETPAKLRRRNSDPLSLSGYVWKRANFPIFRGHKPSVSSMASSLRHLNTDDFDDFIFWEPVPQKMTSCWEMSLYQFKKPWSVLSCSVFRDNRLSNTPGLILENLRNGGNLTTRQSVRSPNERVNRVKENPFDVEPSIAQKNIDIRNWLAALNFPTSTSNSSDVISEGNFTSQSVVDSQNINKTQGTPKRRKVFRNLNFLDKTSNFITTNKNEQIERSKTEEEAIKDLIQRKSGGFGISDILDPTNRLNLKSCLASKSAEEKTVLRETNEYSKTFRKHEFGNNLTTVESGTMVDETLQHSIDKFSTKHPLQILKNSNFERILKENFKFISSEINIWKYLFMSTLFIIFLFYSFNSTARFTVNLS